MIPPHRKLAFSLVEVVLALGVFAFSILAVAGLVPIALQSGKRSVEITRLAAIDEHVAAEVARAGWSYLTNNSGPHEWKFDPEGNITTNLDVAFFEVTATVRQSTQLPGAGKASDELKTVVVETVFPGGSHRTSFTIADRGD